MKTLFTAEAISHGGRSGTLQTPARWLHLTLGSPAVKGGEKRGPNPEQLFAGAHAAAFHGEPGAAANKLGTSTKDYTVRARVSLSEDDQGGCSLADKNEVSGPRWNLFVDPLRRTPICRPREWKRKTIPPCK